MSSFFTAPSALKKRKRPESLEKPQKRVAAAKPPTLRKKKQDEEISSDDESDGGLEVTFEDEDRSSESEDEGETAAERRLKLAERYLENIKKDVGEEVGFDAEEIDRDLIAERLREDADEFKGRAYKNLAVELKFDEASQCFFKSNSESYTAVATCPPYAYTTSKDLTLTKWRIQDLPREYPPRKDNRKPIPPKKNPEKVASIRGDKKKAKDTSYRGHTDTILCVAASEDGKHVVTGGRDRKLIIWDSDLKPLRVYDKHRDAVTGLAFSKGSPQFYSSSKDRTLKVWDVKELAYIETLFGHQDEVVDVAALSKERCVSAGARDKTARYWKVPEESQLVLRGGGGGSKRGSSKTQVLEGSIDRVACIDDENFVSGGDSGSISLWNITKKKPIHTYTLAHGVEEPLALDEASSELNPDPSVIPVPQPRGITALATVPYSDVILSGSWDGFVRAWRVSDDKKKIERIGMVGSISPPPSESSKTSEASQPAARGVINDISVFERGERGKDGICIVAACGKEPRFGRWIKVKNGRNGAVVFEVPKVKAVAAKTNGVVDRDEMEV